MQEGTAKPFSFLGIAWHLLFTSFDWSFCVTLLVLLLFLFLDGPAPTTYVMTNIRNRQHSIYALSFNLWQMFEDT